MKSKHIARQPLRRIRAISAAALAAILSLPALAVSPGDEVTADAIAAADFVKGGTLDSWEEGKVYILECWATWCGPCIAAIPHIDALYDKYHEQGLRVIGMNVFEDGKEKVATFVERKGDGMSYPVAYVGRGGAFEKDWLEPAGVNGIPYAFVVKDGRLLFGIHPAALSEDMIEALLEGGEREAAEVAKILRAVDGKDEVEALMSEFTRQVASDPAAAAATLGKIREIDENHLMLGYLEVQLAMVHEDWPKVEQILEATENPTTAGAVAATLVDWPKEVPASVLTILVDKLLPQINGPDASPIEAFSLASLLWKLDRKEQATEVATQAAASFGAMIGDEFPQAALDAYVDSYKKGEPMSMQDLFILHAQMGQ